MIEIINPTQLKKCMPGCLNVDNWASLLDIHLPLHGITETEQIASFISQVGHESLDFTFMAENLNYSAVGLMKTFGKYFPTQAIADAYARNPQKIANRVYANRMGNRDENSGDGWKYRGSGPLQLTGTNNFKQFGKDVLLNENAVYNDPDKVRNDPETGLLAALWYWDINKLSYIIDVETLTRKVNGGVNGLDDRQARFDTAMKVLTS